MRLLFDTNIIVDLLQDRIPWADNAERILQFAQKRQVEGWVAATSVTTLFYLMERHAGQSLARVGIAKMLTVLRVSGVTQETIDRAIESDIKDLEDAVIEECALRVGADFIVTRDTAGFKQSKVAVMSPDEWLDAYGESKGDEGKTN